MSETLEVEVVSGLTGPGRRLAEARETQGLALEHVAGQLRLSLPILQALESDDYAQLPPATFVAGYLRSYARLLGLPEQEIAAGFAAAEKTPPVGVVARSQPPQVRASDLPVRAVTYLIFGGLALLSALWWMAQSETTPELTPASEVAVAVVPDTVAEAAMPEEPAPAADETVTAIAPDAPAPAAVSPAPEPPPLPVTTPAPLAPVSETTPAATAPAAPDTPPLTAAMPQSKLVLEFSGDCWIEITDAAGRKLAYDLVQAGRTVTLRGEAPFTVFFGYAPAVQVSLNGQVFDHGPYQRRNDTARFRLGSTNDNTARTD